MMVTHCTASPPVKEYLNTVTLLSKDELLSVM